MLLIVQQFLQTTNKLNFFFFFTEPRGLPEPKVLKCHEVGSSYNFGGLDMIDVPVCGIRSACVLQTASKWHTIVSQMCPEAQAIQSFNHARF